MLKLEIGLREKLAESFVAPRMRARELAGIVAVLGDMDVGVGQSKSRRS